MKNIIIKIKPLYRSLKWLQRRIKGVDENARGVSGKELDFIISYAKEGGMFLEIGSAFGQTTRELSKKGFVVTIDPFIVDEKKQVTGEYFKDITGKFMDNIIGERVCYFPLKSEEVYDIWSRFIYGVFDFIFIDGLHTFKQLQKDYLWINFLKKEGYIIFHDTNLPEVNEFIKIKPDKELNFIAQEGSARVYQK